MPTLTKEESMNASIHQNRIDINKLREDVAKLAMLIANLADACKESNQPE